MKIRRQDTSWVTKFGLINDSFQFNFRLILFDNPFRRFLWNIWKQMTTKHLVSNSIEQEELYHTIFSYINVNVNWIYGERFFFPLQRPDCLWSPPSLLSNGYGDFPWGKGGSGVKLIIQLQLVPRSRKLEIYLRSSIYFHAIVLNLVQGQISVCLSVCLSLWALHSMKHFSLSFYNLLIIHSWQDSFGGGLAPRNASVYTQHNMNTERTQTNVQDSSGIRAQDPSV
jgi:hypothetical protein